LASGARGGSRRKRERRHAPAKPVRGSESRSQAILVSERAGYAKARLRMSSMIATAVLRTSSVAG